MWGHGPTFGILVPLSRGRMKLENSNLAQIWKAVSAKEKIQN